MTPLTQLAPEDFFPVELGEGFGDHFGCIYQKLHEQKYLLGFRVLKHHLNHTGFCHGGSIAMFADMQLMAVKHLTDHQQKHHPTKNLNIDYIAPINLDAWIEMEVELVRVTKTTIYTHSIMKVDGKVSVRCTAAYHIP